MIKTSSLRRIFLPFLLHSSSCSPLKRAILRSSRVLGLFPSSLSIPFFLQKLLCFNSNDQPLLYVLQSPAVTLCFLLRQGNERTRMYASTHNVQEDVPSLLSFVSNRLSVIIAIPRLADNKIHLTIRKIRKEIQPSISLALCNVELLPNAKQFQGSSLFFTVRLECNCHFIILS